MVAFAHIIGVARNNMGFWITPEFWNKSFGRYFWTGWNGNVFFGDDFVGSAEIF